MSRTPSRLRDYLQQIVWRTVQGDLPKLGSQVQIELDDMTDRDGINGAPTGD